MELQILSGRRYLRKSLKVYHVLGVYLMPVIVLGIFVRSVIFNSQYAPRSPIKQMRKPR